MNTKKTFCCRFKLKYGYFTAEWITAKNLTKEEAMEWAKERLEEEDKYLGIDDVYETEN